MLKKPDEFFNKMAEALKPFGFVHIGNGNFEHEILKYIFDFSANSIEGIITTIFRSGINKGKQELRQQLRAELGVEPVFHKGQEWVHQDFEIKNRF